MTEEEIIEFVTSLPDAVALTASEASGAPEVAWGDTFFFVGEERKMPFATLVIKDYPGFDEASNLDRRGVFRVNIGVGREEFQRLDLGSDVDYAELDRLLPHPAYAAQSWVCVVNPGPATSVEVRRLLADAHEREAGRLKRAKVRSARPGSSGSSAQRV